MPRRPVTRAAGASVRRGGEPGRRDGRTRWDTPGGTCYRRNQLPPGVLSHWKEQDVSFVDPIEVTGLGNRGYLAGGTHTAVVVDPPRDIDRVVAAAARRGVRIGLVVESHVHNDYGTGGHHIGRLTGHAYFHSAAAPRIHSTKHE